MNAFPSIGRVSPRDAPSPSLPVKELMAEGPPPGPSGPEAEGLAQPLQALALIAADAAVADAELAGSLAAAQALQVAQPQHRSLAGRQLLQQLQRQGGPGGLGGWLGSLSGDPIQERAIAAGGRLIEGGQNPGIGAFGLILLSPRHADGAAQIAGVMEQGATNAAREIGGGGDGILDAAAGEPEGHPGDLAAIIELDQPAAAVVETTGDGIGQWEELMEQGIGRGWGTGHGSEATDARPQASTQEEATLSEGQAQACSRSLPQTLATIRPADQRLEPTAPPS